MKEDDIIAEIVPLTTEMGLELCKMIDIDCQVVEEGGESKIKFGPRGYANMDNGISDYEFVSIDMLPADEFSSGSIIEIQK